MPPKEEHRLLAVKKVPIHNVCAICGAFVVLNVQRHQFDTPHPTAQCPLRGDPPTLLAILQHITRRLMCYDLDDVVNSPQLQRLAFRKAMIELTLHHLDAQFSFQGGSIGHYSYLAQQPQPAPQPSQPSAQDTTAFFSSPGLDFQQQQKKRRRAQSETIDYDPHSDFLNDILADSASLLSGSATNHDNMFLKSPVATDVRSDTASQHQEPYSGYNRYQDFENETSDGEYEQFLTSLVKQDVKPPGNDDEDDPFPETQVRHNREPPEEYRDDEEVQVSDDELRELFGFSEPNQNDTNLDFSSQLNLPTSPLTDFENASLPNRPSLLQTPLHTVPAAQQESFIDLNFHDRFRRQVSQNFQLVMQNLAVSKELQLADENFYHHWKSQLEELMDHFSNQYADEARQVPLIRPLPLVPQILTELEFLPPSGAFKKAVSSRYKNKSREVIPHSASLMLIHERLGAYFDPALLPVLTIGNNKREFRQVEDELLAMGYMEFGNNHHQIQTYMLPNRDMSSLKNRIKSLCARKQPDNLVKRLVFNSRIPLNEREQMTLERGVVKYGLNFRRIQTQLLPERSPAVLRQAYYLLNEPSQQIQYSFVKRKKYNQLLIIPEEDDGDF